MRRLTVIKHDCIALNTFAIVLKGAPQHKPGQFVNLFVPGHHFLKRPFSVADQKGDEILLIYKVFGSGTKALSEVKVGEKLDCLTCLGNGFTLTHHNHIYLIGGGVGIPPLYYLAKSLLKKNKKLTIVLGFNQKEECFFIDEFNALGKVVVTTMDGSSGIKGNVLDGVKNKTIDYYYAVGPTSMLKAVTKDFPIGQVSLEERMGCGFGACMGCSIKTKSGAQRVCKEGPVFDAEEMLWNV